MNTHLRAKMNLVETLLGNPEYVKERSKFKIIEDTIEIVCKIYEGIRLDSKADIQTKDLPETTI